MGVEVGLCIPFVILVGGRVPLGAAVWFGCACFSVVLDACNCRLSAPPHTKNYNPTSDFSFQHHTPGPSTGTRDLDEESPAVYHRGKECREVIQDITRMIRREGKSMVQFHTVQ